MLPLKNYNCVWGLEGSGKSSTLFKQLKENLPDGERLLFGFKNYSLMVEQMYSWSSRFSEPLENFVIAGHSMDYGPALSAYTNPEAPFLIPDSAKYIFTTQAQIQKLGHQSFLDANNQTIKYNHIIVDEFDFCIGLIPSLDYQLKNLNSNSEIKNNTEKQIIEWVYKHYTRIDGARLVVGKNHHIEGFNKAYWLEAENCPITFLTSEVLAANFLELIGFEKIIIESLDFSDCVVNLWSSPLVGRNFFNKMNTYVGWNRLNYDAVISDCVNSYFESNKNEESLRITTLSHTATRGRNDLIGSNILTVLSYIPPTAIKQIQEVFKYFGEKDIEFKDVETLFYRDRLMQAVGRVIGNRGGKVTDVITHSQIEDLLKNSDSLPYKINTNWEFNFEGFSEILGKVEQAETIRKEKVRQACAKDYSQLKEFFCEAEEDYSIPVSDVKKYLKENNFNTNATKVAAFFNTKVKNKRVGNKVKACLFGVRFKNV